MKPEHFREFYVRPVLKQLDHLIPCSRVAEDLIVATACAESACGKYARQETNDGYGPAISILQIEQATILDNLESFLAYRPSLDDAIAAFEMGNGTDDLNLYNPFYAVAHARIKYYRDENPLPFTDSMASDAGTDHYLYALGAYWKRIYNTMSGAGTVDGFVDKAKKYGDFLV